MLLKAIRPKLTGIVLAALCSQTALAANWWVAPDGNDTAVGSQAMPLRSIQAAVDAASGGDNIYVGSGVYAESVQFTQFADNTALLTLQAAPGEMPVLDGSSLNTPVAFSLRDQHYVAIRGFEIRNYSASGRWELAAGVYVAGASSNISILDNEIHSISADHPTSPIANGIGIYGTRIEPMTDIMIAGNSLHDLTLGWSESLVLNGNVDGFSVIDNSVFDNNNIGIDIIGFEQWITDGGVPIELNRARNGVIRGNHIYNIDSRDNPVYGGSRSAGGIYVDGGTDIRIEKNVIRNSNIGVELASESPIGSTSNVQMVDNEISGSHLAGIALGGYRADLGRSTNIEIHHNTLYNNATDPTNGFGEIWFQHRVINNSLQHNIVHGGSNDVLINDVNNQLEHNRLSDNLYFTNTDTGSIKTAGGTVELAMTNPRFHQAGATDFRLEMGSPAETDGQATHGTRADDLRGRSRVAIVLPFVLPHNTWRMLSIPAQAPVLHDSLRAALADDIPGSFADASAGWSLFQFDAKLGRYVVPDIDEPISPGAAYWILQTTGQSVSLTLPAGSRPHRRRTSTVCPDDDGCFEYLLPGKDASNQWVMLGHALNSDTDTHDLRVVSEFGHCAITAGCTLEQAASQANLLHNNLWRFDGSVYSTAFDTLSPWQGYWALVLPAAIDSNAKLVISR